MHPRYYTQRGALSNNRAQPDVVPRELAAKIARERDMLYEELQRTQQTYQRGQQERAALARQIQDLRRAPHAAPSVAQQQAHRIRVLEEALADMTHQRDAAELSSHPPLDVEQGTHDEYEEVLEVEEQEASSSHENVRELLSSMLELRDSIERASAMSTDASNPWKQGLDHMVRQFDEILTSHGWVGIGEVGDTFDPTIHEAIGVHHAAQAQNTEVHEVSRRGFAHEATGELLRTAQVVVSK